MPSIERLSADHTIKELRENGHVPLAILSFDVAKNQFFMALLENVDKDEVNALLTQIGLRFIAQ